LLIDQNKIFTMESEILNVSFSDKETGIRGTASVRGELEDDQPVYVVNNIRFDNTQEEIDEAGLVKEEELRIKQSLNADTDVNDWIDADTEEESELATMIGEAIENHDE